MKLVMLELGGRLLEFCGSTEDPDPTEEGPLRTQYWRGIRHLEDEDEMREAIRQRKMEREFSSCDLFISFFA